MSPKFSILLPAYKSSFLAICIDCVLEQTFSDWELIIVNDASPEDIARIVSTYSDKRIRYYENEHNIGSRHLVRQWNYCLSLAKGDYVLCIGDDDCLCSDCLATYARLIDKNPQIDIFHGQTDIIDENGRTICSTAHRPEWESAMNLLYHRTYTYRHQFIGDFCYKRDALLSQGGFYDLPYAWGSDDISAIRAAEKHGIVNTQSVVFLYRDNSLSITRTSLPLGKINAILLEMRWKRKFLSSPCTNPKEEQQRKKLRKDLCRVTLKKVYYVLYHSIITH